MFFYSKLVTSPKSCTNRENYYLNSIVASSFLSDMDFTDPLSLPVEWFAKQLPLEFSTWFPIHNILIVLDLAKLGILFVLAYPLGIIFSQLKGAQIRYYYGLILGLLYQWIIYKISILLLFHQSNIVQ